MNTNKPVVTKEWLAAKLKSEDTKEIQKVLGRALLAIYNYQTFEEQANTETVNSNGLGFSKPDARVGSIGARMYKAHARLDQWVVDVWLRPAKDGFPRICKYANQLQYIAEQKKRALESRTNKLIQLSIL